MILWYSLRNINIYICSWFLFLVHSSWNLWNFLNGQNHKDLFFYVNEMTFRKHLSTRVSLMAQTVKKKKKPIMQETLVGSLGHKDYLEKRIAIYSTIFAWRIPWTEEPGGLQSIGSQRVGQDCAIKTFTFTFQGWQWKLPDQRIRGLEFIVPPGKLWEGERGWRLTQSPMSDELFSEASIKTLKDGIHRASRLVNMWRSGENSLLQDGTGALWLVPCASPYAAFPSGCSWI